MKVVNFVVDFFGGPFHRVPGLAKHFFYQFRYCSRLENAVWRLDCGFGRGHIRSWVGR